MQQRYRYGGPRLMLRACAGVMCDIHESCARYAMVDGTTQPSAYWLATCAPLGKKHPAYIGIDFCGPPHPRHFAMTRQDLHHTRRRAADRESEHPQ